MSNYHDYEDSDEGRLPAGFQRMGYDADTQQYTYQSGTGTHHGVPGSRYAIIGVSDHVDDDIDEIDKSWKRYMFPWFVLVGVFLLFLIAPPWTWRSRGTPNIICGEHAAAYRIQDGDTCFMLAEEVKTAVEEIYKLNPGLKCDNLQIGKEICLPLKEGT